MKTITKYQCDSCGTLQDISKWVFSCIDCGTEICEKCMYGWATCTSCAKNTTDEQLSTRFNQIYE